MRACSTPRSAIEKARKETAQALDRATPFFRRQIGGRLRLRRVPELEFRFDESIAHQDRIEQILRDLHEEDAQRAAAAHPPRRAPESASRPDDDDDDRLTRPRATSLTRFAGGSGSCCRRTSVPTATRSARQLAMAFALRQLGKEVRVVNRDRAAAADDGVSRRAATSRSPSASTTPATRSSSWSAATWRAPGVDGSRARLRHQHRSPSRQSRMYGALNWFDLSAAACGEMVFDLIARARRAADAGNRDARLRRDPDRHRLVPLLEHHAAHLRHLPPVRRGGRRSARDRWRATSSTATASDA